MNETHENILSHEKNKNINVYRHFSLPHIYLLWLFSRTTKADIFLPVIIFVSEVEKEDGGEEKKTLEWTMCM
jgi:hypothetical protein